jgi:hypothetical protein
METTVGAGAHSSANWIQPLPQVGDHGLQRRDPLRLLTDQRITRIRRRLLPRRIATARNHPATTLRCFGGTTPATKT